MEFTVKMIWRRRRSPRHAARVSTGLRAWRTSPMQWLWPSGEGPTPPLQGTKCCNGPSFRPWARQALQRRVSLG